MTPEAIQRLKSYLNPTGPRYGLRHDDLAAMLAIVEAAQALVDQGREWIGGTKYCPECMAEGWHHDDCKSGQEFWDLRKALEDAVHGG